MKKTFRKIFSLILVIALAAVSVCGFASCASKSDPDAIKVYYVNSTYDDIIYNDYLMPESIRNDMDKQTGELLKQMFEIDHTDIGMYSVKPSEIEINDYFIDSDNIFTIDFSKEYLELSNVQEILLRAALVLTIIQIPEVEGVKITVDNESIKYSDGNEIGIITADDFAGILVNEKGMLKQETDVVLYFANSDGTKLIPKTSRFITSNNNISLEEYIVSRIIAGPDDSISLYPTVSPNVELINVVTSEKVCYVNFSESFLEQESQPVSDEMMIYSIVNSLCRLSYVSSVQFLINGDVATTLHTVMDLSQPFSRNTSLE